MSEVMMIEGVRLTNPDKVLYPEQGITKVELATYYRAVADWMLPHVAGRPVTMVRCPVGHEKKCFYQRHAGSGVLPQLREATVPGFDEPYLYLSDLPGLIAMVQMGVLELHPWSITVSEPARPDRVIFDLDPDEGLGFESVVAAAREVRERLNQVGLRSFVKTTGGKGLHVVVPIAPAHEWPSVKSFAKSFSDAMAADAPQLYLTRMSKAERVGRLFIDYLRNDPTATAVAPYSTRSRSGAPVAMPLRWEELDGLDPQRFTVRTVSDFLAGRDDPWAEIHHLPQPLPSR